MSNIASRTPEGQPNTCPVCGQYVQIEPSLPAGDAPCPYCGCLLWFVVTHAGLLFFEKARIHGYRLVEPKAPLNAAEPDREQTTGRKSGAEFCPGQRVRIIQGTFVAFEAEFIGTNPMTGGAMLSIIIFGRDTPLELPPSFLEAA